MHFTLCTEIMLYNVLKYLFALCVAAKHTNTHTHNKTFKEDLRFAKMYKNTA